MTDALADQGRPGLVRHGGGAAWRADGPLSADAVALLRVPEGRRVPELERVDESSAFRLGRLELDKVPPNRLATSA
ncbi:hypothetical protein ACFCX0_13050 [Streptomyces sp. NPDC056352]|uniref:hypothetical protein n=1 Tax=Streptomyces sp. NPDC056352 TaxID=3345791 RepID=UPI0035DFCD79